MTTFKAAEAENFIKLFVPPLDLAKPLEKIPSNLSGFISDAQGIARQFNSKTSANLNNFWDVVSDISKGNISDASRKFGDRIGDPNFNLEKYESEVSQLRQKLSELTKKKVLDDSEVKSKTELESLVASYDGYINTWKELLDIPSAITTSLETRIASSRPEYITQARDMLFSGKLNDIKGKFLLTSKGAPPTSGGTLSGPSYYKDSSMAADTAIEEYEKFISLKPSEQTDRRLNSVAGNLARSFMGVSKDGSNIPETNELAAKLFGALKKNSDTPEIKSIFDEYISKIPESGRSPKKLEALPDLPKPPTADEERIARMADTIRVTSSFIETELINAAKNISGPKDKALELETLKSKVDQELIRQYKDLYPGFNTSPKIQEMYQNARKEIHSKLDLIEIKNKQISPDQLTEFRQSISDILTSRLGDVTTGFRPSVTPVTTPAAAAPVAATPAAKPKVERKLLSEKVLKEEMLPKSILTLLRKEKPDAQNVLDVKQEIKKEYGIDVTDEEISVLRESAKPDKNLSLSERSERTKQIRGTIHQTLGDLPAIRAWTEALTAASREMNEAVSQASSRVESIPVTVRADGSDAEVTISEAAEVLDDAAVRVDDAGGRLLDTLDDAPEGVDTSVITPTTATPAPAAATPPATTPTTATPAAATPAAAVTPAPAAATPAAATPAVTPAVTPATAPAAVTPAAATPAAVTATTSAGMTNLCNTISGKLNSLYNSLTNIASGAVSISAAALGRLRSAILRILSLSASLAARTVGGASTMLSAAARTLQSSFNRILVVLMALGVGGAAGYAIYSYEPKPSAAPPSAPGASTAIPSEEEKAPRGKAKELPKIEISRAPSTTGVTPSGATTYAEPVSEVSSGMAKEVATQRGPGSQVTELNPPVTLLGTTFPFVVLRSPEKANSGSVRLVRDALNKINSSIESEKGREYRINPVVVYMQRKFPGLDLPQLYEKFMTSSEKDKLIFMSEIFDLMLNKDLATAGGAARTREMQRRGPPSAGRVQPREMAKNLNRRRASLESLMASSLSDHPNHRLSRLLKIASSGFVDALINLSKKISAPSDQVSNIATIKGLSGMEESLTPRQIRDKMQISGLKDIALETDVVSSKVKNIFHGNDIDELSADIIRGITFKQVKNENDLNDLVKTHLKPEYQSNSMEITRALLSSDEKALENAVAKLSTTTTAPAPSGTAVRETVRAPVRKTEDVPVAPAAAPAARPTARPLASPEVQRPEAANLFEQLTGARSTGTGGTSPELLRAQRAKSIADATKAELEAYKAQAELSKLKGWGPIAKGVAATAVIGGTVWGVDKLSSALTGKGVMEGLTEMFGDIATDEEIRDAAGKVNSFRSNEVQKMLSLGDAESAFATLDTLDGQAKELAKDKVKNFFGKKYALDIVPPVLILGTEFKYAFLDSSFAQSPAAVRWALSTIGNKRDIKTILYIIAADAPGYADIYSKFEASTGLEKQKYFNTLLDLVLEFGTKLKGGGKDIQRLMSEKEPIRREQVTQRETAKMKKDIRQQSRFARISETFEEIKKLADNSTNNSLENESLFKNADDFSRSYYRDAVKDLDIKDPTLRSYFTGLSGMYDEEPEGPKVEYKELYPMEGETGAELYESAYPREARTSKSIGDGGLVENGFERKKKMEDIARSAPTGNYSAKYAWVQDIMSKKSK